MDMNLILASIGVFLGSNPVACGNFAGGKEVSGSLWQCENHHQWRAGVGCSFRLNIVEYAVGEWCISVIGMWWKRFVRTVQVSSVLEGGGEILPSEVPHFSRKQQTGPLASGLPGEGEGRHVHQGARKRARRERVGVRGHLQQERGHLHQGVYRGIASRRAHGLHPRFVCADQDTEIRDGL